MNSTIEIRGGLRKYDEITFLKGMAITTIVMMHMIQNYMKYFPNSVATVASFGGTGVHIFFFCSGFGLYLSYLRNKTTYFDFLKKRFLKIYFPYIIVVLISFFIPLFKVKGDRLSALLGHIFLYKMFIPAYEETFGPFWYISTLFQLYLLFIPMCTIKKKLGKVPFGIACVVLSVCWWIFTAFMGINHIRVWGSFFLQYLWEFALGMIIAEELYEGKDIKLSMYALIVAGLIGLGLEAFLGVQGGWFKAINDIPALIGYGALGILLYQWPAVRKIGIWLGNVSFEWYLVHILVFVVTAFLNTNILTAVIIFIISIVVAYGYHILISKYQEKRREHENI